MKNILIKFCLIGTAAFLLLSLFSFAAECNDIYAVYVSSFGSDAADGTINSPYSTVKKAVSALSQSGGTVYICDELPSSSCIGTYSPNKFPVTISGKGFDGAKFNLADRSEVCFGGDISFEDIAVEMGEYSHFNDGGNKIIFSDSVKLSAGKLFHLGAYGNKSVAFSSAVFGRATEFDTVSIGGAYITQKDIGVAGDISLVLNGASVKNLRIGADSFKDTHLGGAVGGNILITVNGGKIEKLSAGSKILTLSEESAFQFIYNNCDAKLSETEINAIPAGKIYTVYSGKGGYAEHFLDENGASLTGCFNIIPEQGYKAYVEYGENAFITDGGPHVFPAGETVNIIYIKSSYPLDSYKIHFNGGKSDESILSIDAEGNISFENAPSKQGYLFEGWYLDPSFKRLVKNGDFVGGKCELYAKYLPLPTGRRGGMIFVNGAQIRKSKAESDNCAPDMRFVTTVSHELIETLGGFSEKNRVFSSDSTDKGFCFGTVILPAEYLGPEDLLIGKNYKFDGKMYKPMAVPSDKILSDDGKNITYTLCLSGFDKNCTEREYTVRPYIKYFSRSGNIAEIYGEKYSKSILQVAFSVLEENKNAELCKYLRENVISAYSQAHGIDLITGQTLAEINGKTELLKKSVLEAGNMDISSFEGTVYYVSPEGSDSADGKSPGCAWKTIAKVNSAELSPGDAVLFCRGGEYRGKISGRPGVTYSAYGSGEKPVINGSVRDYADPDMWIETELVNVYKLNSGIENVGIIAFDHSGKTGKTDELTGVRKVAGIAYEGTVFKDESGLKEDLEFFSDIENKELYLYSSLGNPGSRFRSIEIGTGGNLLAVGKSKNITVDNLHFVYGGSHGVGGSGGLAKYNIKGKYAGIEGCSGLTVKNCIFAWIGGSSLIGATHVNTGRYGNAVEIYGSADGFTAENNWIYQIFDTGITHQYASFHAGNTVMQNIRYSRNLIEYCHWSIEFYNMPCSCCEPGREKHSRITRNVLYEENIARMGGYGWGSYGRETEATLFNSFRLSDNPDETSNFVSENNIFFRCAGPLYRINDVAGDEKIRYSGNIYVQDYGRRLSWYHGAYYVFDKSAERLIKGRQINDLNGKIYFYAP